MQPNNNHTPNTSTESSIPNPVAAEPAAAPDITDPALAEPVVSQSYEPTQPEGASNASVSAKAASADPDTADYKATAFESSDTDLPPAASSAKAVLSDILRQLTDRVLSAWNDYSQSLGRPKFVHKLRVSLRQLRAMLSFAKPIMKPVVYTEITDSLKAISSGLGPVREYDVLLKHLHAIPVKKRADSAPPEDLETLLAKRRQDALHQCNALLSEHPLPVLLETFRESLTDTAWTEAAEMDLKAFGKARFEQWAKPIRKYRGKRTGLSLPKAHKLRIRCKKARYVMSALGDELCLKPFWNKSAMKKSISYLGEVHDADRNVIILTELMQTAGAKPVIHDCKLLLKAEKKTLKRFRKFVCRL